MEFYNKRLKKILYLFLQKSKKLTGDHIALSVGVSTRTVRNDIKEFNHLLKENGAEIVSEIGQGYELKVNDKEKFQSFLKELDVNKETLESIVPSEPEERVRFIVTKLLLNSLTNQEKIDTFDLEEELFISTSTLKKDLKVIENQIKKYDLKISNTKKQGLHIIGDEVKIRYCISEYVFNNPRQRGDKGGKFYEKIFTEAERHETSEILLRAIREHHLQLTDIAYKNLSVHILIMLKRFKNEKSLQYDSQEIKWFTDTREFECAKEIIEQLNQVFGINLGEEVYYLTQHLISSQRFLIDDTDEEYEYKKEIQEILIKIKESTNIDLSDDKQLINGLAMHLSAALQRLRFDMNIRNEFLDSVKNSYPLAFELAVLASEVLEESHNLKTKENEIGFLAMHFGAALERKGLNRQMKRKKVVIVCIAGVATAMLLKEKIQHNFGHRIEIVKTCSAQDLTKELIDQVDIILTTVDLRNVESDKVKKINLFLQDSDLEELGIYIEQNEGKSNSIDFSNIFREELFFTNIDLSSKTEVLEYITDNMVKKGYMTEPVKKSVFKREEMATTELGSLVAIPHALLNDMEEALVSVMILKKPILWDKERVQVVLLLNIPQSKHDLWEQVFKTLYRYLIGESGVTKLLKHASYEQFIEDLNIENKKEYRKFN